MEPERFILGIETSCDETAAAVVRDGREVMSNVIASQHDLHAEYRGVVPEIASRAHAERLLPVVERALAGVGISMNDLDAVAVGNRPGLIGSLLVGVAGAKALAWALGVPVIGVDHVRAHLVAGLLHPGCRGIGGAGLPARVGVAVSVTSSDSKQPGSPARAGKPVPWQPFPAIGLVVSGGHTSLYLCESTTEARRIGATIDDAVGEAYDKVAAILGLEFPGGPSLDRLARTGRVQSPGFPIARIGPESLDFSFSGLKTAALYALRGVPETERHRAKRVARGESLSALMSAPDVAATFQDAAIGAVMLKLDRALEMHPECRTVLVGGGVSANSLLRERLAALASERSVEVRIPAMEYCLDNGAMIAALGHDLLAERGWVGDELGMTAMPTSAF